MKKLEQIALFDMDGSLFDYEGQLRKQLNLLRAPSEPEINPEDSLWRLEEQSHVLERMRLIKSVPGWWRNLPKIEMGFQIYKLAKEIGFENQILTKGPRSTHAAWTEKLQCCQDHFGLDIDVHVVMNKKLVYGKFLYDDFPDYMDKWLSHRPRGLGIMPVTPHNKDYRHPNVVRWDGNNLDEVQDALIRCFNRQSGESLVLKEQVLCSQPLATNENWFKRTIRMLFNS